MKRNGSLWLLVLLGFFVAVPARAAFDGIYKSDDSSMNAVVQTYSDRFVLILLTADLSTWTVFQDSDYVDAVSVPDLTGKGFHLDWNFVDETHSQAALKSPDGTITRWTMQRWFSAPAGNRGTLPLGDGWYLPVDESVNVVYQTYDPGFSLVLLTSDFLHFDVFLDSSHLHRMDVDELTGKGTHLTLSNLNESQLEARYLPTDGNVRIWLLNRKHASPGDLDQLDILGCTTFEEKLDATCSALSDRFSCTDSCIFFTEHLFGREIRFCLGNPDCVVSISNCATEQGWIYFEVQVLFPYQCVPAILEGCCGEEANPLLLADQPSMQEEDGSTTFFVSLPDDG